MYINPGTCLCGSDSGRGSSLLDRAIADRRQLNAMTLPDFSDPETGRHTYTHTLTVVLNGFQQTIHFSHLIVHTLFIIGKSLIVSCDLIMKNAIKREMWLPLSCFHIDPFSLISTDIKGKPFPLVIMIVLVTKIINFRDN